MGHREAEIGFGMQKVVASITKQGERRAEVGASTAGSHDSDFSSDVRSKPVGSRGSRTQPASHPHPKPLACSGSLIDDLPARARASDGLVQPRDLKQSTRRVARPVVDATGRPAKQGATAARTKTDSKPATTNPSRTGGGTPARGRLRSNGGSGKNRSRDSSESSNSSSSSGSYRSRKRSNSRKSTKNRKRSTSSSSSSSSSGYSRRRSISRSTSSSRIRSRDRDDSECSAGRVNRNRHGYEGSSGKFERGRSSDRVHEPSHGGGWRNEKSADGFRSRHGRDSRERSSSSRGNGIGQLGQRKTKQVTEKRYERYQSRNGDDGSSPGGHTSYRSRSGSRGKDERGRASVSRDRTGRGGSKGRRASDDAFGRSDHRRGSGGGDPSGSLSTQRHGVARDHDEDPLRTKREELRHPETPHSRPSDERQSTGSPPSTVSALSRSSCGSERLAPATGKISSVGGSGDGSVARELSSGTGNDISPLAGGALRLAYDRSSIPTSSLERNPSIEEGDLFSSLEDQLTQPAMRAVVAAAPGRPDRSSLSGPPTPATTEGSISLAATTVAVANANAPISSTVADTVAASAAKPNATDVAPGERLLGLITGDGSPLDEAGGPPARGGDEKSKSEDRAVTIELNLAAASMVAAAVPLPSAPTPLSLPSPPDNPRQAGDDTQGGSSVPTRNTSVTQPPSLPPPALASKIPTSFTAPASTTRTEEALSAEGGEDGAAARAPQHVREENEVLDDVPPLRGQQRAVVVTGGDTAPTDAGSDPTRPEAQGEVTNEIARQAPRSGQEGGLAEDDEVRNEGREEEGEESDNGKDKTGTTKENGGSGKEDEHGQVDRHAENEKGDEGEELTSQGIKRGSTGASTAQSKKPNPWYSKDTLVLLNCDSNGRPGTPRPSVAIADLLGRPVSV